MIITLLAPLLAAGIVLYADPGRSHGGGLIVDSPGARLRVLAALRCLASEPNAVRILDDGRVQYQPLRPSPVDLLAPLVTSVREIHILLRAAGSVKKPGRAPVYLARAPLGSPAMTYSASDRSPIEIYLLDTDGDPGILPASCMFPQVPTAISWEVVIVHELGHALAYLLNRDDDVDVFALAYEDKVRQKLTPSAPRRLFHRCAAI